MPRPALLLLLAAPLQGPVTHDVKIQSFQYTGQFLTIKLGESVRWTNFDSSTHTVTEGTDLVLNGNEAFHHNFPGASGPWTWTFDATFLAAFPRPEDTYNYFCVPHSGAMQGSIKVENGPGQFFCFCAPLGPCSNRDYGAGCSIVGSIRGGRLLGAGTTSVAADDLRLEVDLLPPNRPGLFFRGLVQTGQVQFGEGWRCIGGTLRRFPAQNSGAAGKVTLGPGVVAMTLAGAAPIAAGQTWLFQFWFRDATSPCGNATNVSNGYSIAFAP